MDYRYAIIGVIVIVLIYYMCYNQENFERCPNCQSLNKAECMNCNNCGYCVNNVGVGKCVQGNKCGPYFKSSCTKWMHPESKCDKKCDCKHAAYYESEPRARNHIKYATDVGYSYCSGVV